MTWLHRWSKSDEGRTAAEVLEHVCDWSQHQDRETTCRVRVWLVVRPVPKSQRWQYAPGEKYEAEIHFVHADGRWIEPLHTPFLTQAEAKEELEERAIERWGR